MGVKQSERSAPDAPGVSQSERLTPDAPTIMMLESRIRKLEVENVELKSENAKIRDEVEQVSARMDLWDLEWAEASPRCG